VIIEATCTYESLLSGPSKISEGCVKFERNKQYKLDLSDPEQRKLLSLFWKQGTQVRWCFEFDRASASSPADSIWFCKDCGAYFDKFNEMGTHMNSMHQSKLKKQIAEVQAREEEEGVDHDEEPVIHKDQRGKQKGRTYKCKTPGCETVCANPYEMRIHKQSHEVVAAPVEA